MKTLYVRDENRRPLGVLIYEMKNNVTLYGLSICNPQDKWDRNRALTIAEGRFQKAGLRTPKWCRGQSRYSEVYDLLSWLAENVKIPRVFAMACRQTAWAVSPKLK